MVASNKNNSIKFKNKKKNVGHLLSVSGWVLQKQMLRENLAFRKCIRGTNLWKQGGGTRHGQREKVKCGVDLVEPWSNPQGMVWNIYSVSKFSWWPKWLRFYPPTVIRMGMGLPEKGKSWVN